MKTVLNQYDKIIYDWVRYSAPTWKNFSCGIANDTKQLKGVYQPLSMNQNALKRKYERQFAANY